jgi:GR25 family glycosyltransferase involved in LPS biosynthesis
MDSIDKFIYINLKRRTDRNEHILKELKRYNIPQEKIERFEAVEHEKGMLGCAMSHLEVMKNSVIVKTRCGVFLKMTIISLNREKYVMIM